MEDQPVGPASPAAQGAYSREQLSQEPRPLFFFNADKAHDDVLLELIQRLEGALEGWAALGIAKHDSAFEISAATFRIDHAHLVFRVQQAGDKLGRQGRQTSFSIA